MHLLYVMRYLGTGQMALAQINTLFFMKLNVCKFFQLAHKYLSCYNDINIFFNLHHPIQKILEIHILSLCSVTPLITSTAI